MEFVGYTPNYVLTACRLVLTKEVEIDGVGTKTPLKNDHQLVGLALHGANRASTEILR